MFSNVKHWLSAKRNGRPNIDTENLPTPKAAGDQSLFNSRLIVLDLETTGLNTAKDEVIAIGAVAIEKGAIHLDDQFDLILRRPELDIRETVLIHGIGPEALTQGQETKEALLHLLEWMNGDPILAYHAEFDKRFLERTLRAQLGYSRSHVWMDVAELMPAFFPKAQPKGRGLDHWSDLYGLEVSERHHAAADAMVTAELTLIALKAANKSNVKTLKDLSQKLRYQRRLQKMKRF
ncbi:DNA polymerase III PolC-type [Marinobacter litoralis]|uniref:DNA-directed DNA polymerase n=1 Tax=Marinobacter litoralis TaxID=187981 RepID=A0A3M2RA74_9GAMM|nr:3'-5' exonuclease [Marinobacter litoralis]RMJ02177.1 DNA polymerase III PolC-type [Marinobacter litoralis]